MSEATAQSGLSDNAAGALAYVTIIPAIIFLVVEPYSKNSYIRFHSWQSIFLNVAWFAVWIVFRIILAMTFFSFVGWLVLMPILWLAFFIAWLIAVINAGQGKRFKLPIIGDLATKQAGA